MVASGIVASGGAWHFCGYDVVASGIVVVFLWVYTVASGIVVVASGTWHVMS